MDTAKQCIPLASTSLVKILFLMNQVIGHPSHSGDPSYSGVNLDLLNGVVDGLRLESSFVILLTLLKFYAFHLHEEEFVTFFKLVLCVWQQFNQSLVLVGLNVLDHEILEIIPILIHDLKFVP